MAQFWSLQLRPVLVVWLLLTVPVVCHHHTAEMVLGALVAHAKSLGGHASHQPSSHAAHYAVHHGGGSVALAEGDRVGELYSAAPPASGLVRLAVEAIGSTEASPAVLRITMTALLPRDSVPERDARWCAHRSSEHARFLPEGQGSVALRSVEAAALPEWQSLSPGLPHVAPPAGRSAHPPAPPPRLTA